MSVASSLIECCQLSIIDKEMEFEIGETDYNVVWNFANNLVWNLDNNVVWNLDNSVDSGESVIRGVQLLVRTVI